MTEETRNVIMRNGKMYVGGDVTKEYVDNAIDDAVADIDDDISALSDTVADKVDKETGKGLSTNDFTDADKALVQDSPITVSATGSDLTLSTSSGSVNALTVFGKSEVVDGAIKSAGEGYAVVDLGTLNWERQETQQSGIYRFKGTTLSPLCIYNDETIQGVCARYQADTLNNLYYGQADNLRLGVSNNCVYIRDDNYTDATAFKNSLNGVILAYQLADPTQGNCIAVKTDNGSGIDGTIATFTTGTPLYGVSDTVRDVMMWDGSAGTVTKNCNERDLGSLTWQYTNPFGGEKYFFLSTSITDAKQPPTTTETVPILTPSYSVADANYMFYHYSEEDKKITFYHDWLIIDDKDYTDAAAFKTAMSGVKFVYELATPTTEQLTTAENASIAGLRTFEPQTHAQNNAGATMTIEAYANTANGRVVSDMQPTRSPLLTLSASGWTNNVQTVTYAHDTSKRNTIDVEPTSIKAWTAAGILATAETASTITFECDTVPASDLSFRVTSMEVR